MIEDYGTLSEGELLTEIKQELEERSDLDVSLLEFNFEGGKLNVHGNLANDEDLQSLVNILENHIDPEDYDLEVELLDGDSTPILPNKKFSTDAEESKDGEAGNEEPLSDMDDDEMDFVEEDEIDDEKW